jgi:hypothetical protein
VSSGGSRVEEKYEPGRRYRRLAFWRVRHDGSVEVFARIARFISLASERGTKGRIVYRIHGRAMMGLEYIELPVVFPTWTPRSLPAPVVMSERRARGAFRAPAVTRSSGRRALSSLAMTMPHLFAIEHHAVPSGLFRSLVVAAVLAPLLQAVDASEAASSPRALRVRCLPP